jgi:hypothetical protein
VLLISIRNDLNKKSFYTTKGKYESDLAPHYTYIFALFFTENCEITQRLCKSLQQKKTNKKPTSKINKVMWRYIASEDNN